MIRVNGGTTVAEGTTVAGLLATLGFAPGAPGIAVAVDGEVVSRGRWEQTELAPGMEVEIVQAVQGG